MPAVKKAVKKTVKKEDKLVLNHDGKNVAEVFGVSADKGSAFIQQCFKNEDKISRVIETIWNADAPLNERVANLVVFGGLVAIKQNPLMSLLRTVSR